MPLAKTPTRMAIQERTKLRANEQRRVEHAEATLKELIARHNLDERDAFEIGMICLRLIHAIKNQHLKDNRHERLKARFPTEGF